MFEPDDAGGEDGAAAQDGARAHGLADLDGIYRRAPVGALTIAGVATAIVLALWLAFYSLIFLPRSGS